MLIFWQGNRTAAGLKLEQRAADAAVEQLVEPLGQQYGVGLHILADPFQHHAHQRIFEEINDELIQAIKNEPKVCHYLDMPIQHASDAILKRMGRRTSRQELIDIITKLRKEIPDIALRTTLITGFPGETKQDHEQMMEFVDSMEFDRLGVFTYSPEEGTPAAEMDNQIDEEVKEQWRDEVMELQQEVSLDKSADMVGKTIEVMIEGKISDDEAYVGRSYKDAPNVDGFVFVNTTANLMSGAIVRVEITGAMEYDLIGSLVED